MPQRLDLEQEKLALFAKRYNVRKHVLLDIMDAIVDQPFVVVGDVVLDRYQYCDATDLAGDGPMMSLVPLEKRDYLGGAAMIARHIAGLGAEPTLITSLGCDDASDGAIDDLESAGVHVLAIRNRKKIAMKTRFVVDTQKLFTLDEVPGARRRIRRMSGICAGAGEEAVGAGAGGGDDGGKPTLILYDAGLGMITDSIAQNILEAVRPAAGEGAGYARICGGTAGSRRLGRLRDTDLLVATERAMRVAMRDHEQGLSALAYHILNDFFGGKGVAHAAGQEGAAGV